MATSVPSARRGTRLSGGGVPWLAQASMASSMARNSIEVRTMLRTCWQTPRVGAFSQRIGKVLRAGPEIDAHRRGLRQVVALGVRVHERSAPLPVLGGRLRVQDERVGLRPLQMASVLPVKWSVVRRKRRGSGRRRCSDPRIAGRPEVTTLAKRWFIHIRPAPATCGSTPSNTRRPRASSLKPRWTKSRMQRPVCDRPQP